MTSSLVKPISVDQFTYAKELFRDVALIAAIDKGCSLVKILYSRKSDNDNNTVTLICETYNNKDFHSAIDNFMERVQLPTAADELTVHVTGGGCEKEMHILKQKLSVKVKFIDEFFCQAKGTQWIIQNTPEDILCYPERLTLDNMEEYLPKDGFFTVFRKTFYDKIEQDFELFQTPRPCFLAFMGSASGFLDMSASEHVQYIGSFMFAGKGFLSLGKLLLDTTDYNEIISLAETGDCCNVDTVFGDLFGGGADSEYGDNELNTPFFSFGKAADQKRSLNTFQRQDIAASLVRMMTDMSATSIYFAAKGTGHKRVYIGGNFVRSRLVRIGILNRLASDMLIGMHPLEVRFIQTGHTGAMGAMLASPTGNNKIF